MYGGGFLPRHLFLLGEEGVWYDPSDLTTLFQDSAGTTPVTADGDPVGLMLDKSKGLVLGPELVTNGDFSSGTTGWGVTVYNSVLVAASGGMTVECITGQTSFRSSRPVSTVVGKTYKYTADLRVDNGSPSEVRMKASNTVNLDAAFANSIITLSTSIVTVEVVFTAQATSTYIGPSGFGAPGDRLFVDNISVKELPGNHAAQTVSSARPVLDEPPEWFINFDGVDDKHTTTFTDLGTDVTIARASPGVGAVILTGQTIGAGPYDYSTDHAGLIIVNRALTAAETTSLTTYLNKKAGV